MTTWSTFWKEGSPLWYNWCSSLLYEFVYDSITSKLLRVL